VNPLFSIEFVSPLHGGVGSVIDAGFFRITIRVYVSTADPVVTVTDVTAAANLAATLDASAIAYNYCEFSYKVARPANPANTVKLEVMVDDNQAGRGKRSGEIRFTVPNPELLKKKKKSR